MGHPGVGGEEQMQMQRRQQIPFGDDNQKGKDDGERLRWSEAL
jgi:hypothetical protein